MIKQYRLPLLFLCLLHLVAAPVQADVRVPGFYTNHMVLQRDVPIRLRGWAKPGEKVDIQLGDVSVTVKADASGVWGAILPKQEANSTGQTLVFKPSNTIVLEDILVGEVWLCSGQSNMEWRVSQAANPQQEIANANHPMIRFFDVPKHVKQNEPQEDAQESEWKICSPETIGGFSAVGYFFGRELQKELNIPIGLIGANWGGQRIEPFTPPIGFKQVPSLEDYVKDLDAGKFKGGATQIYNGMVAGLAPYSVKGAIWYQGESNAGDGLRYNYLKEALVKGWRSVFQNDDLSFYWVQLADFRPEVEQPGESDWAELREAQTMTMAKLPNTGQAVIIDIGEGKDIHPRNKVDVGMRLARWALANEYGLQIPFRSPEYQSMEASGNQIILSFANVNGGWRPFDTNELQGFTIAGEDQKFVNATATLMKRQEIALSAGKISDSQLVRYQWANSPKVNLYDRSDLPLTPFRTDDWPGVTVDKH